jgi:DNA segregation ATPase FtsK/SpoIIIE-like protein
MTMAARRAAAPRRSTARAKRQPVLEPREHAFVLGSSVALIAVGTGLCTLAEPGPAGAAVHSGLLGSCGLLGSLIVTVGLGWTGVELLRSHTPSAATGTAFGCLLGVLGSLGLLGLAGWGGAIGAGTAGIFAPHIAWLSVLPLAGVTVLGAWLAGFRRDQWLAVSHPGAAVQAARATVEERWSAVTSGGVLGWLASRWRRGVEDDGGGDARETNGPTQTADAPQDDAASQSDDEPQRRDRPWLSGPISVPWLQGPVNEAMEEARRRREDQGLLPLDADDPQHAADARDNGVIVLPSPAAAAVRSTRRGWKLPAIDVLDVGEAVTGQTKAELDRAGADIEDKLRLCRVPGKVIGYETGSAAVTQFVVRPDPEVDASKYKASRVATNVAMALSVPSVRVLVPIPGTPHVGIEVPKEGRQVVPLRSVVTAPDFVRIAQRSHLALALGSDAAGKPVIADLARLVHLLIGGTTGSGKSKLIEAILACIMLQSTPDQVRTLLIDPKRVGLSRFNGTLRPASERVEPHLLRPVVTPAAEGDMDEIVAALQSLWVETDRRYQRMAAEGVEDFADWHASGHERMPRIVAVIDELSDVMQFAPGAEDVLCRIASMGRAAGVHLVVATQSPRAEVITGKIKANLPSKIALTVESGIESRIILDAMGAEKLTGMGDMIFRPIDGSSRRLQGALVTKPELGRLIGHWTAQAA